MQANITYISAGKISADKRITDITGQLQYGLSELLAVAENNARYYVRHHDPEALHQYRVALRRAKALLKANRAFVASEYLLDLKRLFRSLTEPTGRLRDLEVFSEHLKEYTVQFPELFQEGARCMQSDLHWEANKYRQKILSWFLSDGFKSLLDEAYRNISLINLTVPVNEYRHFLHSQFNKVQKKISERFHKLSALSLLQLHQLRILVKNQRYVASFYPELMPGDGSEAHKTVQTMLGQINDYAMQRDFVTEYIEQKQPDEKNLKSVALFSGALIGYLSYLEREKTQRLANYIF